MKKQAEKQKWPQMRAQIWPEELREAIRTSGEDNKRWAMQNRAHALSHSAKMSRCVAESKKILWAQMFSKQTNKSGSVVK